MKHSGLRHASDTTIKQRAAEAHAFFRKRLDLRFFAGILNRLRLIAMPSDLPWNQDDFYFNFPIARRFAWLEQRPDIRARVTSNVIKLSEKSATALSSGNQAELIGGALKQHHISITDVDRAFSSEDLVVYGDAHEVWLFFWKQLDWDDPLDTHRAFVAAFLHELIDDHRHALLMPAVDLRAHLGGAGDLDWIKRIPAEVQAAVNLARLKQEKDDPSNPLLTRQELHLALQSAAVHLPVDTLKPLVSDIANLLGLPTPEMSDEEEEERTMAFQLRQIGKDEAEIGVVEPQDDELSLFQEAQDPRQEPNKKHPDAPGLDMSGISARPPAPRAKEGSPSSPLGDIQHKIRLQDRLLAINSGFDFNDTFFESYAVDELLDLITIIETRTWPSDSLAARTIILNFVLRFGMSILKLVGKDDKMLRVLFYKSLHSPHPT